jgi:anaphase-promoting complex subunit 2
MEIPDCLVLRNVTVWVNHGVLSFSNENSELTTAESFQDSHGEYNTLNEDIETAISVEAQEQKELKVMFTSKEILVVVERRGLQVLESYIVGMLSNFGSLPIQRIHNMLSTFARSGAQPCMYQHIKKLLYNN